MPGAEYDLRLTQVLDDIWPNIVLPYFKELILGLGELHDYAWWKGLTIPVTKQEWKHAFRNKTILPHWEHFLEGADYPEMKMQFGDEVELETAKIGSSFMITEEYILFADRRRDLWPDLQSWLDDFGESALRTLSRMHAAPFLDAFDGEYFADALDDEPLCSTNHTGPDGNIVSNLSNLPLSLELLDEFWGMKTQFMSQHDDPISYNFDTIVFSEDREIDWFKIRESIQEPGDNKNDRNFWYRRLTGRTCPYLREAVQTGASRYVFVIDSRRSPFRTLLQEPPNIRRRVMEDGDNIKVLGRMFANVNWPFWTGILGSKPGS